MSYKNVITKPNIVHGHYELIAIWKDLGIFSSGLLRKVNLGIPYFNFQISSSQLQRTSSLEIPKYIYASLHNNNNMFLYSAVPVRGSAQCALQTKSGHNVGPAIKGSITESHKGVSVALLAGSSSLTVD